MSGCCHKGAIRQATLPNAVPTRQEFAAGNPSEAGGNSSRPSCCTRVTSDMRILLCGMWLIGLAACPAPQGPAPSVLQPSAVKPQVSDADLFTRAVADAADRRPDEVRKLVALSNDNKKLLVGSWMEKGIAYKYYWPSGYQRRAPRVPPIWITKIPEFKQKCSAWGLSGNELRRRAAQLLGLKPDTGNDTYVEMRVDLKDVLRPCLDPEPTDEKCDLNRSNQHPSSVKGIADYPKFLDDRDRGDYPFTRLGYTYDWSPDSSDHYGTSEFMLAPEASYVPESITSLDDYCRRAE